jgi:hypothetical protein
VGARTGEALVDRHELNFASIPALAPGVGLSENHLNSIMKLSRPSFKRPYDGSSEDEEPKRTRVYSPLETDEMAPPSARTFKKPAIPKKVIEKHSDYIAYRDSEQMKQKWNNVVATKEQLEAAIGTIKRGGSTGIGSIAKRIKDHPREAELTSLNNSYALEKSRYQALLGKKVANIRKELEIKERLENGTQPTKPKARGAKKGRAKVIKESIKEGDGSKAQTTAERMKKVKDLSGPSQLLKVALTCESVSVVELNNLRILSRP